MYKKALSLLLALMLIVTSFSVAIITVAASGDDASVLTVTATSNFFPTASSSFTQDELDAADGYVTVTYSIQSEENLLNTDWLLTYDGTVLQFDEEANTTGEGRNAKLDVMPCVSDEYVNADPSSVEYGLRGNCTSLNAYPLNDGEDGNVEFVKVKFKVIGTGDTTVDLRVIDLRMTKLEDGQTISEVDNETQVVDNGTVYDSTVEYATSTEVGIEGTEPEDTTAPEEGTTESQQETTEAPEGTTEAEEATTEPGPVDDDTYIVAGTPADIFGTAWDGSNAANTMTKQDNGTYTKDYTVNKAYDAVQLKAVKNGSEWIGCADGNNVTFNVTGPGTFTVVYDPVENYVYVTGDNVEEITELDYNTVYAVGNGEGFWLNGAAWDPAFAGNEMTQVADDVWEITFENVPDGFERQIKFAIDGAWTHNFGGAFVESGVETDAAYNGDNIAFDTDDVCTVKAQLDLRNFDFSTKEGAKFTITITYDEEEETTVPEETTEPVAETTTAEEETTAAPEETTEAGEETTGAPAPSASLIVKGTSNIFPETVNAYDDLSEYEDENGDVFVTVEYKLGADGQYLINIDGELTWDPAVLEFKEAYNKLGTGRQAKFTIFPFAYEQGNGGGMVNSFADSNSGRVVGNYTSVSPAAYAYEEDGSPVTVVRAVFKVLDREAGYTTVNFKADTLSLCDENETEPYSQNVLVSAGVVDENVLNMCDTATVIKPDGQVEPPVEPTTVPEEETTVPEEETTVPAEETTVPEDVTTTPVDETTTPVDETTTPVEETTTPDEEGTTTPEEDNTYVVAGAPADVFGTAWDAANQDNLMEENGEGKFEKSYTVDTAYYPVQLKVVKNGSQWLGDETGNNVTFNVTGPGTFTVTIDPETNEITVTGDNVETIAEMDYDTVYAVGNGEGFWLNGAAWDPAYAANEMTQVSENVWEIEYENVPDGFERQIKFAIDGAWTHNFGGVFEDSGVESDAVYNGDNITFDTDDVCTVKAQLDLRDFNFSTKEGAKFTITITYAGEEESTAPAETTAPVTEPDDALTVDGTSNYCPSVDAQTYEIGDQYVRVTFKAPEDADIVDIQWGMNYDKELLELTGISTFDGGAMMINTSADTFNVLGSLCDIDNPYHVNAGDDFITFVFEAKAPGTTTVDFRVIDMTVRTDDGDEIIYANEEDKRQEEPEETTAPEEETTEIPEEGTTAAPEETTVEGEATTGSTQETTEAAGDLTVDGTSNYCASVTAQTVAPGESVTVSFKAPEDRDIVDIQWGMNYDKDLLQLTGISTFDGGAMLINTNGDTYNVIGSLTDITNPYQVTAGSDFITFVFEAKAPGTTTVDLRISDMTVRTDDGDVIIFENEEDKRQDEPTEETTAPEEETTVEGEETTVAPEETTAPEEETTAPEEGTTAPEEGTTAPEEGTTAPEEGTTAPEEGTTAPEEGTTAPEEGTTAPEEGTTAPEEGTTAPEEGTTAPDEEGTTVPEGEGTTAPDGEGTTAPDGEGTTAPDGEGTTTADDTAGTSSTDATSATGGTSTADQSTPDNGGSNNGGFVQTGNASMAIIILLVLLSATVGIWFARRKVK